MQTGNGTGDSAITGTGAGSEMRGAMSSDNSWHLDKRVPIAIIIGLVAQLLTVVWLASGAYSAINVNAENIEKLDGRMGVIERSTTSQAIQLGRIEENTRGLRSDINRLLSILERQNQ